MYCTDEQGDCYNYYWLNHQAPVFLDLKNPLKAFEVLRVQYDRLTLICEQSEATSKQYRQLLPPVVQTLVNPSEPLAKEEEALSGAGSQ